MAGIGYELRKLLRKDTLLHIFGAYFYAAVISTGPWVVSIIGILLVGLLSIPAVKPYYLVSQFQVSITYIIAISLILTGGLQLTLTRFVADRMFEKDIESILPNIHGALFLTFIVIGILGFALLPQVFPAQGMLYRMLFMLAFGEMSGIWILAILLSGLKRYKAIVTVFFAGNLATVLAALALRPYGLNGLLGGFALGHWLMLLTLWLLMLRSFPARKGISFAALGGTHIYPSLIVIGMTYNLAVWIDKMIFWFRDETGDPVIGALRASMLYDLPIFLAYLSIIPGMAVFLLRIETDFAEYYSRFYEAVRGGASLRHIRELKAQMVLSARQGLEEIVKIQGLVVLCLLVVGESLMRWLGLSILFLPLLQVQAVAATMQVMVMALFNVFFYLDERRLLIILCIELLLANAALTWWSIELGPIYYGYGYAIALLLTLISGLFLLDRSLQKLEYRTFMLQ